MQTNIKRQDGYVYHIDLKKMYLKARLELFHIIQKSMFVPWNLIEKVVMYTI